jgi:hypothetical protein
MYAVGILIIFLLALWVFVLLIHHHFTDDVKHDWVRLAEVGWLQAGKR